MLGRVAACGSQSACSWHFAFSVGNDVGQKAEPRRKHDSGTDTGYVFRQNKLRGNSMHRDALF